LLSARTT